jgi:DNA-binding NtrC family response regulator
MEDWMSKSVIFMVCDSAETIESAKKYWEAQGVTVQAYSSAQWRDGLGNAFFRQQLVNGVPNLASGLNPITYDTNQNSNVVQFPGNTVANDTQKVQKMEDLEAKAIEDAILQYKGNLTEAAKALGIGRATLYRKVKQYQIDPSAARRKRTMAA